jgi:hypothetical protein
MVDIKDGKMTVSERNPKGQDVPVLEISRDVKKDATVFSIFADSATGSRKSFSVEGKKTYWDIQKGPLWSDAYPYSASVSSYTEQLNSFRSNKVGVETIPSDD